MTVTTAPERVLRVRDVATHLGCDTDTVYALIRKNEIRAIRLGRVIRIPE
ncbi:MAG: helix-turn-helix protein, partial [Nocardioides sp.]|nr:helix-turn-helix protein [Nocardioides sp.]